MTRIVVTGPESSGKTTLARALAEHYQAPWVAEYARTYLAQLGRSYHEDDLLTMARGQVQQEDERARWQPPLLICDTSLLVIRIWSEYRYGRCHPWIIEQLAARPVDGYLLCRPDIPWQPDPQRENPHDRDELFGLYEQALSDQRHTIIEGPSPGRLETAIRTVNYLLRS